jgi:DNA-directed RNA polymerase subunit RPC12/RpoP
MFGLHVSSVHDNVQNNNCESSASKKDTIIEDANIVPDKGTLYIKVYRLNIKDHQCSHCNKVFSQQKHLMLHSDNVHSDVDTLKCDDVASETSNFGLHESSIHDNAQNYNYESSKTRKDTIIESKVHEKKKHYTCNKCGAQRGCQNALDNHIEALHPARTKSVKCEHCDFAYYTEDGIRSHVRAMHAPELMLDQAKDNKCSECDFAGTQKSVKLHFKVVHCKKKQQCFFRDKAFLRLPRLNAEINSAHRKINDKSDGRDRNTKAVGGKKPKLPRRVLVTAFKRNIHHVTRSRAAHKNNPTLSTDLSCTINIT